LTTGNALNFNGTNLLIGTTSDVGGGVQINSSTAGNARITLRYSASTITFLGSYSGIVGSGNATDTMLASNGALAFGAGGTSEQMRLNSSGNLLVGNTAPITAVNYYKAYIQGGTSANSNSTALADQKCGLYLYDNEGGNSNNENAQNALVIAISQGASSNPANMITGYVTYPTPLRTFQVTAYGSVYNNAGVYGTLSDQKVKQDIIDATSQWQDIKNVRIRKYRLKSEVERNENAPSFIGVVAQELEQTSPNLVDSPEGCETDENVFKTVKTSILQMKALKALQEAMERIETLETTITAQSATITSLTEQITALEAK
jgi:chaperonin cofactor prefoldin